MRPLETTATLTTFERRGPGTDAERRASRWLVRELRSSGYHVDTEPFWCRPNWAPAHAWHVALALAGSLLSVSHPTIGTALLATALLSIASDAITGVSPGRRLTPERASQNVVARQEPAADQATTLIVTANYDAGRTALVYRDAFRRPTAWLRRAAGPLAVGWLGALQLAIIWLLAIAVIRIVVDHPGTILGAIQLAPSIALVLALALLLEAAAAGYGPAAGDDASGVAVAIALANALQAAPPRNLAPELLLQGAGEGHEIGLRTYLRGSGRDAIVLGIAASGAGQPRYWRSDGRLIPLPYARRLRQLASEAAPHNAQPHRGPGATPALPALARGLPAIAIGAVDRNGLVARSHQASDTPDQVDPEALDGVLQLGLLLVDAIDRALEPATNPATPTPA
jgi:hypothetical protein